MRRPCARSEAPAHEGLSTNAPRRFMLSRALVASPFAEPALADARTPPYRALGDYAAMQQMAPAPGHAPIRIGYRGFYRLLENLVVAARGLALDAPLLIQVSRPLGVPLPATLLAADVLLLDTLDTEFAFWARHARRGVLGIAAALRREPHEHGNDCLHLQLASRVHESDPLGALVAALGRPGAWRELPDLVPTAEPRPAA